VTDVFKYVELAEGRLWMRPEGVSCFAGDLPEQTKACLGDPLCPAADLLQPECARHRLEVRSQLVHRGQNDRTVHRNWNDSWETDWCQSTTLSTAATSRCCPHPDFVVNVIREAAKAVRGRPLKLEACRANPRVKGGCG